MKIFSIMRNQLITLLAFLALPAILLAETAASDTTIRYKNKVIKVEDQPDQVKVKVYETRNGKDTVACKQIFEGIYSDGKSYETWSVIEEIGIQLPGLGKPKNKKQNSKCHMEPHYAGIGIGYMNVTDDGNPFHTVSSGKLALKAEETTEWFINLIEHNYSFYNKRLSGGLLFRRGAPVCGVDGRLVPRLLRLVCDSCLDARDGQGNGSGGGRRHRVGGAPATVRGAFERIPTLRHHGPGTYSAALLPGSAHHCVGERPGKAVCSRSDCYGH